MSKSKNFSQGRLGESLARQFLEKKGFQHLQSNFHTRFGEIDLIMTDNNKLIFIEVKLKSPFSPGTPEQMISAKKISQIHHTALSFLQQNQKLAKAHPSYRIDAICIVGNTIRHYPNISL